MTTTTTAPKSLDDMTTTELADLLIRVKGLIADQAEMMDVVSVDTVVYDAMLQSHTGLLKFQSAVAQELRSR